MSNFAHRGDTVLVKNSASLFGPGDSYRVGVFEVGAVVSVASASTTATVDTGHGFATNDYALLNPGSAAAAGYDAFVKVTGTAANSLTLASGVTLAVGDVLFNLGPDAATGNLPQYDGSPIVFSSDMDGGVPLTGTLITCDTNGNYGYFWEPVDAWELILDAALKPVGKNLMSGGVIDLPASSTDNAVARFDGATGAKLQNSVVIVGDTGNVSGVSTLTGAAVTVTGAVTGASAVISGTATANAVVSTTTLTDALGARVPAYGELWEPEAAVVVAAVSTTAKNVPLSNAGPAANVTLDSTVSFDITINAGYAGVYRLSACGSFLSDQAQVTEVAVEVNGVSPLNDGSESYGVLVETIAGELSRALPFAVTRIATLAAGDVVQLTVRKSSGTTAGITIFGSLTVERVNL